MDLSLRLKAVADFVQHGRRLADIGTDHAYVPLYLLDGQKIDFAIACDINKGPLLKAEANIIQFGANKKIVTRLGNGFLTMKPNEVDVAVIAGMGGMLTIEILKNSPEIVKSLKQLVLQPQLDIDRVRHYLHESNFSIENEAMIFEDGKFYTIISAVPGIEKYHSEACYQFGKLLIDKKDTILKEYILKSCVRQKKLIDMLKKANTIQSKEKLKIVEGEVRLFEEVLLCL